jgi:hypothetical protein
MGRVRDSVLSHRLVGGSSTNRSEMLAGLIGGSSGSDVVFGLHDTAAEVHESIDRRLSINSGS